jgi:Ca2+-binding EF-hand superfamily protein
MRFPISFLALSALLLAALPACRTTAVDPEFLVADANGDGVIDAAELDDHVAARFLTAYDADGDKGISFEEWNAVNPEADRAKFKARDKNGDGKVDMAELLPVVRANPTFGKLMESIDKNGDGVAQPSEAAEFRKHMTEL